MKRQILNIFLILIILVFGAKTCFAVQVLDIGLILDGKELEYIKPKLEKELQDLVGHKTNIKIDKKNIIEANWSKDKAIKAYNDLTKSKEVDFIIGIGIVTSNAISSQSSFTKPTLCFGAKNKKLTETKKNLAYISVLPVTEANFEKLNKIYPYKKLAIVSLLAKNKKNTDKHIYIQEKDLLTTLEEDSDIDAVYLGYLGEKEDNYKVQLIKKLKEKGYLVLGFSQNDLKNGAYAIFTSESITPISIKNVAMIIDDYIDGKQIKGYQPINIVNGQIVINVQTAKEIKKMPSYEALREIIVYNENVTPNVKPIDIKQVILYALENNLDLSSKKIKSEISKRELQLGKRAFFPTVSIGSNFFFVDEDYSNIIHQRSGMLVMSLNQLIYSDQAISNILASKNLMKAQEFTQAQASLDAVKNASKAYLNILKAQNKQNIYKNLLDFSRKNLELREKSQELGQTAMSDVYRWKTEYSMNKNNYIKAKNTTEQTRLALNNTLNKPISTVFVPTDINLNSDMFKSFENQEIKKIVDNPISSEFFADFLTQKALAENPVLKASAEQINATERMAGYYKRKNFVPTISLNSFANSGMYTAGNGPGSTDHDIHYAAAIMANWDIFDGDKNRINYKKTKLEINNLETQRKLLQNNIEYTVRASVIELVSKSANIDLSAKSADYAKKNLDLIQKSYNLGRVSIIELLNAKNAESKAQMQYLDSVYDYLLSVIDLQTTVGTFNILSTDKTQKELYEGFQAYLNKKEKL